MEEENQFTNTFQLYQEKVKREIESLKDECVDFANTCQQKEKEVTSVFSKLKETEVRFSEKVDVLQRELKTLKAEKEKEEEKKKKFYQDRMKREVASLRDLFVDFQKFCQEKENMITDSFEKLHKGTTRQKDEEEMYHTLQEDVRQYELRCAFECGRVSVLEEKVTVIIDENTVGFADEEDRLQKEFGRLQAKMIDNERKLASEVDRLRKEHETLKAELTNIEIKLTSETKSLLIDRRMLEAEKDKLGKHLADKENELSKQYNELQRLEKNYKTSENKCKEHEKTIARNNDKLEGMTRVAEKDIQNQCEMAKLKAEMQRLSKNSGASLTYYKANIAGLGDLNHPSKLAEVFSEIYDNEWTDAYETVTDDEENNKIQFMLKILKDVDAICENIAKRHADAIADGLTQIVVRFKVRKAPTDPTLDFDERALKLVDTHLENPAITKDVPVTGKFGDPSAVKRPIKHCNNETSTPNKTAGEQGDALATHENLAKEIKGTNQSQSENGMKDNQLKPGKMETTDSKRADETATGKTHLTDNANINMTQSENGAQEKRLEPGNNNLSTSNKTDGKQTDETDTYQNLPSKIESTSNSKLIQDNGRTEQEHTEKEADVDFELGERKDEKVDPDTTTFNTEQEDAAYIEKIDYEERSEIIQFQFDELPTAQKQFIEDIRRRIQSDLADQVIKAIGSAVLKEMGPNQADEIRNYVSKCSLFCWTALSHNPPVYVDFMEVTENMRFDMNVYKPYTRTGPLVDYIVWPPIYLHKGGPMLSKGVAQGKKNN